MEINKGVKDPQGFGDFVTIVFLIILAGLILSFL